MKGQTNYREDKHSSDYEKVINPDGEVLNEKIKGESDSNSKIAWELVEWSVKDKREGRKYPNPIIQLKKIKELRLLGITPQQIKDRWEWLEGQTYYQESGIDFGTIVYSFNKKPNV